MLPVRIFEKEVRIERVFLISELQETTPIFDRLLEKPLVVCDTGADQRLTADLIDRRWGDTGYVLRKLYLMELLLAVFIVDRLLGIGDSGGTGQRFARRPVCAKSIPPVSIKDLVRRMVCLSGDRFLIGKFRQSTCEQSACPRDKHRKTDPHQKE